MTGGVRILTREIKKVGIAIAAVQENRFNKDTIYFSSKDYQFYYSSNSTHHVFGTAFVVALRWKSLVLDFKKLDERICVLRIKGRFKNYSLINAHAPINDSENEVKDDFYELLSNT